MSRLEVKVPDIGDFTDVPVVELLVAEGDDVEADAPLLVLESDKASMEIPAPEAGKVVSLPVKVGDKVSEGTVVAVLEAAHPDLPVYLGGGHQSAVGGSAGLLGHAVGPAAADLAAALTG